MPRENQLSVAFDSDKRVGIANLGLGNFSVKFMAILATYESPNLIRFNVTDSYAV
jgi:hypothetical protein